MTLKEIHEEEKSTFVQIINEVNELTDDEKRFVLYWVRAKKNAGAATAAVLTLKIK